MEGTDVRKASVTALHAAAIRLLRHARQADAGSGLSAARLSALSVLVFGGARTVGELAAAEQVSAPTMTRLVQALEAAGYVLRQRGARDGRMVVVHATARARRALEAARSARVALLLEVLQGTSAEEWAVLTESAAVLERRLGTGRSSPDETARAGGP